MSDSVYAYEDMRRLLDQALATEKGLKVRLKSHGEAISLRHRLNAFRKTDRAENKKIYEPSHHMFGRTVYDKLKLVVKQKGEPDDDVLEILIRENIEFAVEEIK